jgi:hypothetical protein
VLYNPACDLYDLLSVSADASEEQLRYRIDGLRGVKDEQALHEAARLLLEFDSRTRYDTQRATHRMRLLLREGLGVFSGRTPASGVLSGWPSDGS